MNREDLKARVLEIMGSEWFIRDAHDFYGGESEGFWTSGESAGKDSLPLADYYGRDNSGFGYWVHPEIQDLLEVAGWYLEWNDPGTVMLYPE